MASLNQMELQNLRHLIGSHCTTMEKMQTYAQQTTDQQIKSYFEKSAKDAQDTKQKLMSFLN
jgi:hypothetical protein